MPKHAWRCLALLEPKSVIVLITSDCESCAVDTSTLMSLPASVLVTHLTRPLRTKGYESLQKGGFSPSPVQARFSQRGRGKKDQTRKRQRKYLSSITIVSFTSTNEQRLWPALKNQTIGLPVIGLTIPELQMLGGSAQRLMLHGW